MQQLKKVAKSSKKTQNEQKSSSTAKKAATQIDRVGKKSANDVYNNAIAKKQNGIVAKQSVDSEEELGGGSDDKKELSVDKKIEQEVLFIQDAGFNIKIQSPGTESFEIQVFELLFSPF